MKKSDGSSRCQENSKYTLTEDEKEDVKALKKRCDREDIAYSSIFELAKYCFVSSSITDTVKRQNDSFNRIKKKRIFEKKYKLDEIDLLEAVDELEINIPNWAVACGKVNGKSVVGYTSASVNPEYMNKNYKTLYKVEMARYDLAASDLEEARQGFYIIATSKDLKANPLRCMRIATKLKLLFDKMNANRIKGIITEAPRAVVFVSNIFLSVVPKTVKERIKLVRSFSKSKFYSEHADDIEKALPEKLGGEFRQSLKEWFNEKLEARAVSDERVCLEL